MEIYQSFYGRSYRIEHTNDTITVFELQAGEKVQVFYAEGEDAEEYLELYLESGYFALLDHLSNLGLPEFE